MAKREIKIGEETVYLTDKEILFSDHYIITSNATESAIKAGYSENCAGQQGHENLKKPEINKYIRLKSKPIMEQLNITQEKVLKEIASIAFSNVTDYLNSDWSLKEFTTIDKGKFSAVKNIDKSERGFKVQFHDKLTALKILHELLNPKEMQQDGKDSFFKGINDFYNRN
jgi:phage terminase small subunit